MKIFVTALLFLSTQAFYNCTTPAREGYSIPGEFEEQEYTWLSWIESGFLGGAPFYETAIAAMKEITPQTKVRLFYGPQLSYTKEQIEKSIWSKLLEQGIDTSRVHLFYNEKSYGAIQDPGPIFLRNEKGELAVADFNFSHPDKRAAAIDSNVARQLNLPLVSSNMVSEGGAWQTNGKGILLLVESVELDRNKNMTKAAIEKEYNQVLGTKKIIWLKKGLKEEEWGRLENGIYGIGTGGHIDEFCRFANDSTILLAEISEAESKQDPVSMESYRRMEAAYQILKASTDQDGKAFTIIRIPAGPLMTKKLAWQNLSAEEKSWFENNQKDSVEFYLATGYLNFIISNGVVVTAKFWKDGLPEEIRQRDEQAKTVLAKAFLGRKIAQIDCMPLHHDGAGLHCHSRNQPVAVNRKGN